MVHELQAAIEQNDHNFDRLVTALYQLLEQAKEKVKENKTLTHAVNTLHGKAAAARREIAHTEAEERHEHRGEGGHGGGSGRTDGGRGGTPLQQILAVLKEIDAEYQNAIGKYLDMEKLEKEALEKTAPIPAIVSRVRQAQIGQPMGWQKTAMEAIEEIKAIFDQEGNLLKKINKVFYAIKIIGVRNQKLIEHHNELAAHLQDAEGPVKTKLSQYTTELKKNLERLQDQHKRLFADFQENIETALQEFAKKLSTRVDKAFQYTKQNQATAIAVFSNIEKEAQSVLPVMFENLIRLDGELIEKATAEKTIVEEIISAYEHATSN